MLLDVTLDMIAGARSLRSAVRSADPKGRAVEVLNRSSVGLERDLRLKKWEAPKLVITSPPYPGVHVLYHRWQVDGRKEIPLPFMITNKLDGAGGSYYTMGDRKVPKLKTYFDNIQASMTSVAAVASSETIFVQMVAFSDAAWQLPTYLHAMAEAGLTELKLPSQRGHEDGRLWRDVPSRRWYSEQRGRTPASKEVVLFHRRK